MLHHHQFLPTYKHDFLGYPSWEKVKSEHYIFNFTPNSAAQRDINNIIDTQERAYTHIISTLTLEDPSKKIEYFFYPSPDIKEELMGDDWYAQSIYSEFRVHVLYTDEDKPIGPHEDTHLLTLPWGLSWHFLQEGLAEFMVGHAWDGTSHREYVQEGLKKGYELSPAQQLTEKDWLNTDQELAIYYYSLAGSWVSFLVERYSLSTLIEFYKNTDRSMSSEEIQQQYMKYFAQDVSQLESLYFNDYLKI